MAGDNAPRDKNFVTALLATSSVDGVSTVAVYADPTTHRLLVDSTGTSSTTGTEVPIGAIDGSNVTFTTTNPPGFITVGGIVYFPNDGFTFTGSGPYTLTLTQAPFPNQTIHSVYFSTSI